MASTRWHNYYERHVKVDKQNRTDVLDVVEPIIESIISDVAKRSGGIFSKTLVKVGSYYQGLKTGQVNEFDYNVPLLGIDGIKWVPDTGPVTWGFRELDDEQEERTTCRKNLTIVEKNRPMYEVYNSDVTLKLNDYKSNVRYKEMVLEGYLVPYMVKQKFRQLLEEACDDEEGISLCQRNHGPAWTIKILGEHHDLDHNVDVDFAPTIHTELDYPQQWGWPHLKTRHLIAVDKFDLILSKGLNLVAKENFYWTISFAEMEKELCRQIKESSGCRKKVHRIMKVLFKKRWRHGTSLSTYELKNAWLWYCEEPIHPLGWHDEFINQRLVECSWWFLVSLRNRQITQYFNVTRNLLDGKNASDLDQTADNIEVFYRKSPASEVGK